jgi:hypothetical protein
MGIQAARIYFYDGILPMQMVRDKFHELTGFYPICFVGYYGDGKSFELECGTEGHYFYRALLKTFFELGIRQVDRKYNRALENDISDVNISIYLHPYNQNEKIWTDIKRWKDYPETDRPEK